jgi:NAD(P)H-hydrate repair Nnr-like enzyme with NAD(P)H-hydrate dehydratase domain
MLQSVVILKGPVTSIVVPQGGAWSFSQGSVGLATSGSGDTLAGIVGGLLARGASPLHAALWGVYLHGEAGNRLVRVQGHLGFLARELLAEIPGIMQDLKP